MELVDPVKKRCFGAGGEAAVSVVFPPSRESLSDPWVSAVAVDWCQKWRAQTWLKAAFVFGTVPAGLLGFCRGLLQ